MIRRQGGGIHEIFPLGGRLCGPEPASASSQGRSFRRRLIFVSINTSLALIDRRCLHDRMCPVTQRRQRSIQGRDAYDML